MRPLGFLTGVVLGSAAAISLVLLMVLVTLALSRGQAAQIGSEYAHLAAAAGLFAALAALAGTAFVGLQRDRPWRWSAQAAMWLFLAGVAWYFLPEGG
jgi:Na+-driven multidrug efflux pump